MRLDKFLTRKYPDLSRAKIQRLIKEGAVKVNGEVAGRSSQVTKESDLIEVSPDVISKTAKNLPPNILPQPEIPLKIVYEDKDIVVINKQAGLLTHPTEKQSTHTLVNALIARYPEIAAVGEDPLRPGIVHRLDKDTSGLLVTAKNQEAFIKIKDQFLRHSVAKKYLALVEDIPGKNAGVIEYDIRPSKQNRLKKVAVQRVEPMKKSRRAARTEYKVLKTINGRFALLEVRPLTGRTHQIRVHLSAIGHPVVGDKLYGSKTAAPRQFLHAYYLKLTAPSGASLTLETELPKDLKSVLDTLSN